MFLSASQRTAHVLSASRAGGPPRNHKVFVFDHAVTVR